MRLQTQRNALTHGLITTRWRVKLTCDLRGSIKLRCTELPALILGGRKQAAPLQAQSRNYHTNRQVRVFLSQAKNGEADGVRSYEDVWGGGGGVKTRMQTQLSYQLHALVVLTPWKQSAVPTENVGSRSSLVNIREWQPGLRPLPSQSFAIHYSLISSQRSAVDTATTLRNLRSRFVSLLGARNFSLFLIFQTACGAHPASYSKDIRVLSRRWKGRGVMFTTHPLNIVTRLRMSGAIPLLLIHAFMTWTGGPPPFTFCSVMTPWFNAVSLKLIWGIKMSSYRGADKSLARPGRTQATATEDFDFLISYL